MAMFSFLLSSRDKWLTNQVLIGFQFISFQLRSYKLHFFILNIKNRFYSRQMKQFFTIYKNMPISKNYPVFSYLFLTWQKYIKQLEYTTLYFQNVLSLGSVTSNILPLTNIVFSKKLMHTYRLGLWSGCYLLCGVIKVIYQIF